jgi:hypothetical protein
MKIKKEHSKKLELGKIKICSLSKVELIHIYGGNVAGVNEMNFRHTPTVSNYTCNSGANGCATVSCNC